MTRWIITALALLGSYVSPAVALEGWGDLQGRIVVEGELPATEPLEVNKDLAVCGRIHLFDESLSVGADGGLRGVVVCLLRTRTVEQHPEVHPSYDELANSDALIEIKDCRVEPHVCVMRTSQKLVVRNQDEVGHNLNIQSVRQGSPVHPPSGREYEMKIVAPEIAPVRVVCGAHPWMTSVLLVRDEPYMAVSSATGEFEIKNLPEGTWTFVFWHEHGGRTKEGGYLTGLTQNGQVLGGRLGEIEVSIKNGEVTDLGTMTLSAERLIRESSPE